MTTLTRLIAAATLISAAALAPGLAAADDRDDRREERGRYDRSDRRDEFDRDGRFVQAPAHQHDARCGHDPRLQPPPAAPAWTWRDDLRWDGRAWVRAGWERQERGERYGRVRALRFELVELERDRAAYHARFARNPRKLARYDASYLDRRADLERALQRLTFYAWR
jgi:hypothetical protein